VCLPDCAQTLWRGLGFRSRHDGRHPHHAILPRRADASTTLRPSRPRRLHRVPSRRGPRPLRTGVPVPSQSTRFHKLIDKLTRAGQFATAIAAIVGTVLLVVDRLTNDARPARLAVSLTALHLQRPVTLRRFLAAKQHLRQYATGLRAAGLATPAIHHALNAQGIQVSYKLEIQGPPGRQLDLKPIVYRPRGLIPVPVSPLTQTELYKSEAWQDKAPDRTWVAYPPHPGHYYIVLDMTERRVDQYPALVATTQTHLFRVKGE
jgi:hypothetical protein